MNNRISLAKSLISIGLIVGLLAGAVLIVSGQEDEYANWIEYEAEEITQANPGTIKWDEADIINQLRYEWATGPRSEKGVKVTAIEVPGGELYTEMTRSLAQKEKTYDVLYPTATWLQDWAKAGFLEPIGDAVPESEIEQWAPTIRKAFTIEGKLIGTPQWANPRLLMYRKSMFEEAGLDPNDPPETWAELKEYAKKLTKDTDGDGTIEQYGYVYAGKRPEFGLESYLQIAYSGGGRMFTDTDGDGEADEVTVDSKPMVEALKLLQDLEAEGYVPAGVPNFNEGDAQKAFYEGRAAMLIDEPWVLQSALGNHPGDVGAAMYPHWSEADPDDVGGLLVAVAITVNPNISDTQMKAAKKYARFFGTYTSHLIQMVDEGNGSAIPAVYDSSPLQTGYPAADVIKKSLEQAVLEIYPNYKKVEDVMGEAISKAFQGQDPEKVLTEAAEEIREIEKDWLG